MRVTTGPHYRASPSKSILWCSAASQSGCGLGSSSGASQMLLGLGVPDGPNMAVWPERLGDAEAETRRGIGGLVSSRSTRRQLLPALESHHGRALESHHGRALGSERRGPEA